MSLAAQWNFVAFIAKLATQLPAYLLEGGVDDGCRLSIGQGKNEECEQSMQREDVVIWKGIKVLSEWCLISLQVVWGNHRHPLLAGKQVVEWLV